VASFCGYEECVVLLLKSGAEFDIRNIEGETPLEIASEAGHQEIVDMLRGAAFSLTM
jgi:ankyrin repeat protein